MTTKPEKLLPSILAGALLLTLVCGCGGGDESSGGAGAEPAAAPKTAQDFAAAAAQEFALAKGPEALSLVREARNLKPESAELALFEGEAMYLAGEEDSAIERFAQIAGDTKLAAALRSQAYTDRAVANMERPGPEQPADMPQRVDLAVWQDLVRAVLLDIKNSRAWYHLGKCAQASRFNEAALNYYVLAKGHNADSTRPLDERHVAKIEALLPELGKTIAAARAKTTKDDRDKSNAALEKARNLLSEAKRAPATAPRRVRGARSVETAGEKRAQAKKQFLAAIEANPSNGVALLEYADLLASEKKADEALQYYRRAVKAAPSKIATYHKAAGFALDSGKAMQAEPFLYAALAHLTFDRGDADGMAKLRKTVELYAKTLKALNSPEAETMAAFAKEL